MKLKLLIIAIVLAGAGYIAVQKNTDTVNAKKPATEATTKLGAASVLNIDPKVRSIVPVATIMPKLASSSEMQLFRDKKDWPGIYQRAKNGSQTGEALYLQAELLEKCAKRPPSTDPKKPTESREVKREKFLLGLAGSQEQKAARTAAYDALTADICGELRQIDYAKDEVARLTKAASDAGDVHGRAWQLSNDIAKASEEDFAARSNIKPDANGNMPRMTGGNVISDEQWAAIRELLSSGDVGVLGELKPLLATTLTDASIRLGSDNQPIDNRALWSALGLVACDLGQHCGADSPQLLAACAFQNHCGSSSVQDHTYYYESSPHNAQLVDAYRQQLAEMIRTGNFSSFNLIRGAQNQGNTFTFRNR